MSLLKLQVIGNVGGDAIVNNVNGKLVVNFSVAHTEKWKDAQGVEKSRTTWVNCSYWSERTAVAQYIKKGTMLYAEGQPEVKIYTDKQGQPQPQQVLRVSHIQLLGGNKDSQQSNNQSAYQQPQQQQNDPSFTEPLDDLPF